MAKTKNSIEIWLIGYKSMVLLWFCLSYSSVTATANPPEYSIFGVSNLAGVEGDTVIVNPGTISFYGALYNCDGCNTFMKKGCAGDMITVKPGPFHNPSNWPSIAFDISDGKTTVCIYIAEGQGHQELGKIKIEVRDNPEFSLTSSEPLSAILTYAMAENLKTRFRVSLDSYQTIYSVPDITIPSDHELVMVWDFETYGPKDIVMSLKLTNAGYTQGAIVTVQSLLNRIVEIEVVTMMHNDFEIRGYTNENAGINYTTFLDEIEGDPVCNVTYIKDGSVQDPIYLNLEFLYPILSGEFATGHYFFGSMHPQFELNPTEDYFNIKCQRTSYVYHSDYGIEMLSSENVVLESGTSYGHDSEFTFRFAEGRELNEDQYNVTKNGEQIFPPYDTGTISAEGDTYEVISAHFGRTLFRMILNPYEQAGPVTPTFNSIVYDDVADNLLVNIDCKILQGESVTVKINLLSDDGATVENLYTTDPFEKISYLAMASTLNMSELAVGQHTFEIETEGGEKASWLLWREEILFETTTIALTTMLSTTFLPPSTSIIAPSSSIYMESLTPHLLTPTPVINAVTSTPVVHLVTSTPLINLAASTSVINLAPSTSVQSVASSITPTSALMPIAVTSITPTTTEKPGPDPLAINTCQLDTGICFFDITMDTVIHKSCYAKDLGTDDTIYRLECGLQTTDCTATNLFTFEYKPNLDRDANRTMQLFCVDLSNTEHLIYTLSLPHSGDLGLDFYEDPYIESVDNNMKTRIHLPTVLGFYNNITVTIREIIPDLPSEGIELQLTCDGTVEKYCDFVNPQFITATSTQELCIKVEINPHMVNVCKNYKQLSVNIISEKRLNKRTGSSKFDSLFPVTFQYELPSGEQNTEIPTNITWKVTHDNNIETFHGSPTQAIFQPGDYTVEAHLLQADTFSTTATASFSTSLGINATYLTSTTSSSVNEVVEFHITIHNYGISSCFLLDVDEGDKIIGFDVGSPKDFCENQLHLEGVTKTIEWIAVDTAPHPIEIQHTHAYSSNNIYNTKLRAFDDSTHNQTALITVYVAEEKCDSPKLTLTGVSPNQLDAMKYFRKQNILVECGYVTDCVATGTVSNHWSITTGESFDETVESPKIVNTDQTDFRIPGNVLPYGLIRICNTMNMASSDMIKSTECGYAFIQPSPLIAVIDGGSSLTLPQNQEYHIQSGNSKDPDTDDLTGVTIIYTCHAEKEDAPEMSYDNLMKLPFIYPSSFNGGNSGGCYGTGIGRLPKSSDDSLKVVMQPKNMIAGMPFVITMFMLKNDGVTPEPRTAITKQVVTFESAPIPVLKLSCKDNCGPYVDLRSVQNFQVTSLSDTEPKYSWKLFMCGDTDADPCDPVDNTTKIQTTDPNTKYFSARPNSYTGGKRYRLEVYGTLDGVTGKATLEYFVANPPHSGTCDSDKVEGYAMTDRFQLYCKDWLPSLLTYRFYATTDGVIQEFYEGQSPRKDDLSLPMGNAEEDYSLTIYFTIMDSETKVSTTVNKTLKIRPPKDVLRVLQNMTDNIESGDSMLDTFANSGDLTNAVNTVLVYSSIIKNTYEYLAEPNSDDDVANKEKLMNEKGTSQYVDVKNQMRSNIVQKMSPFVSSVGYMPQENQLNSIAKISGGLSSVTEFATELNAESQQTVFNTVEMFASAIDDMKSPNADNLKAASAGVFVLLADVTESCASVVDVNKPENDTTNRALIKTANDTELYKQQCKKRVEESRRITKKLEDKLIETMVPGGEVMHIDTKKLKIALGSVITKGISKFTAGKVSAQINMDEFSSEESVNVMIRNLKYNLYTTDGSAEKMTSEMTGVDISSPDRTPISVEGSQNEIVITVANRPSKEKADMQNYLMGVESNGEQWSYQEAEIRNTSFSSNFQMNQTVAITVYMRENKRPTPEKYDMKFELPDNSSCEWNDKDLFGNMSIDLLTVDWSDVTCRYNPYRIFLSDRENLDGVFKIGIRYIPPNLLQDEEEDEEEESKDRRRRSTDTNIDTSKVDSDYCVVVLPPPPTPAPTDPPGTWETVLPTITNESIQYKMETFNAKCMFWNETTETWASNGCYVGPNTTPEITECLCDHLTDFGGDLVVAPAPIDFSKVFAGLKNLGDNLGVLMVILVICLVYVLFVVWARKKDRKDKEQSGPVVIDCMNGRGGGHPYLVTIVTGSGLSAGTTANIYCKFSGSKQDSKIIPLKATDDRKIFKARTTTTFKIILPDSVGELDYLRIFHDNKGRSPAWYLRNIVVTDLLTKQQYPFVCDSWLAVESEDGEIDKMLPIASDKELAGFHIVFAATASKGLLDGHIWFSVFTRPQGSTFTRVQRASCCLCLIYLTMVTNAMFFGAGDASPKTLLRLGNMVINITGIIIGIEASLIVIPPSMFVIEVFRRLAPPKKKQKKNDETINEDNEDSEAQDDEIDELEEYQKSLSKEEEKDEEKQKKPFQFPYFFKYIAYTVIVLASFGSALFTFFYSMMWGPKKSNQWLGSMFAGFFQSVFVIQPIKAAMLAVLFALILRKPVEQEHAEDKPVENNKDKEDDEEELEGDDDGDGMIQADEVPVIMPSESKLERYRKMKIKEKLTGKIVKDIVTYLVFLLLVSMLAYGEKDPNAYWFRNDLHNMFVESKYAESMRLEDASNPANFYLWLRDTMMTSIFVGPWYNDKLPKSFKYLDNREDLLISIPRLRQQRVKPNSCKVHSAVEDLIKHCEPSYSSSNEDETDYDTAWVPLNHTSRSRRDTSWFVEKPEKVTRVRRSAGNNYQVMAVGKGASLRRRKAKKTSTGGGNIFMVSPAALLPDGSVISCSKRWIHYTMSELRGFPVVGKFATYHGSGYVSNLGYNEETGWTVIADLHAHNWIDQRTRAVFVEFTVYNANINLFATAFLYMEILPTGAGVPSSDFKIFNGYRYALNANMASRLLEVVFVGFVIYFTILEIKKMKKQGFVYVQGFFNIIEITLVPLYVMMFGLIIFRWLSTAKNIKTFHENPKDFVSFQYSAEADAMLQGVIGIVCFLLNIKFLKYFQFAKSFYEVGLIMKSFFYPLMGFMVAFFTYFIMFATAANLGFGTQSENYHTFMRTCVTQFLHLLGATDFEEARDSGGPIFGPIYYIAYSAFVMIISFNVLMAIICGAIDEDFEEEFEKNLGDIQVVEYLLNRFKTIAGFEDDPDDDDEADEQFDNITQNYEDMDRKMRELEDTIAVFMRRVERFENREDADELLCAALNEEQKEDEMNESKEKESNAWI